MAEQDARTPRSFLHLLTTATRTLQHLGRGGAGKDQAFAAPASTTARTASSVSESGPEAPSATAATAATATASFIKRAVTEAVKPRCTKEGCESPDRTHLALCKCPTQKRGEPVASYARRLSKKLKIYSKKWNETGPPAHDGVQPTVIVHTASGRTVVCNPRELAEGLLAASKEI